MCGMTSKLSSHRPCQSNRTNDETAFGFLDQFFVTYLCCVKNNAPQVFDLFFSFRKKLIFKAAFGVSVSDNSSLNLDLYKKFCSGVCLNFVFIGNNI